MLPEVRYDRLGGVDVAEEVDRDERLELVSTFLVERAVAVRDACVVDPDVDAAVGGQRVIAQREHVVVARDVSGDAAGRACTASG